MKLLLLTLGFATALADNSQTWNLAVGSNKFSAGVYKELAKFNKDNFVVSPLSVDVLLALLYSGAAGKTAQEIAETLNLPKDKAEIDKAYTKLASQLKSTKSYDLISANKVYLKNDTQINKTFNTTVVNVFAAELQNINFAKNEESANEINRWVEEKTQNKIHNLVSAEDMKDAVVVLVNAIYFRGKWVTQFNSDDTKIQPFHVKKDKVEQVPMMAVKTSFKAEENYKLNAKVLEMPYEGDDITMTLVLPNDIEGLPKLEARIGDVLDASPSVKQKAHVLIPKFKLETSIDFIKILKCMGIKEAFSMDAEFPGVVSSENNPVSTRKNILMISKIIQKAFIEIEEKGTTAAAATAAVMTMLSVPLADNPVFEFVADHPFIYYIKSKGTILFIGKYTAP